MMQQLQYLTQAEIREFNSSAPGRPLSEDKFYLKVFLLNDQLTNSSPEEGGSWKVAKRGLARIARSVVGRPLIVPPDTARHFRGASGDPEEIITLQQKWAIAEFVREVVNTASSNAYGIAEVFKEYINDVKRGLVRGRPLPKYVSPLVEPYKMENGEVVDGRILHVQAVDAPGFSPMVAKIVGSCTGMLEQCSAKLRHLGAASQLKAWQRSLLLGASGEGETLGDVFAEYNQAMREMVKLGQERARQESLDGGADGAMAEIDRIFDELEDGSAFDSQGPATPFEEIFPSLRYRGTNRFLGANAPARRSSDEIDYDAVFESARRPGY